MAGRRCPHATHRAQRDEPGHRWHRRTAAPARGFAERSRRARLCLFHQSRKPQSAPHCGKLTRFPALPVVAAGAAGGRDRHRDKAARHRIVEILSRPTAGQPTRRLGVAPEQRHLLAQGARNGMAHLKAKFAEGKVPLLSFWGGFRVRPATVEFWQGGPNRLHDRFQYARQADDSWVIERLAP